MRHAPAWPRRILEEHIPEEEEQLFPTFESMTGDEELEALGAKMERRFQEVTMAGPEAALAMRPVRSNGAARRPVRVLRERARGCHSHA